MKDEEVSRLLHRKSDISSVDTHRNTALHKATIKGNREIAHILLEKGANPRLRGNDGRTPLQIAVQDGNKPMVSLLLAGGADTSTRSRDHDRLTVLHEAVLNGDEGMVALLLGAGADTLARSKSGLTVLHLAVQRKNIAILDLLLRTGVEVSARSNFGMTAL
ncbi:ankyrin, partial [Morchella conica CCBAS932]